MVEFILHFGAKEIVLLSLYVVGTFFYTLMELWVQGKLINMWKGDPLKFWGMHSYLRKYSKKPGPIPTNLYYRFFGLKAKERFPGSATIFVWLTDGYHLSQFIMLNCISLVPAIISGHWWMFLITRGIWWIVFNLTYKLLGR